MCNHEGYRDPTADLAVRRVFRQSKKKKLRFMGMSPVNTGVMSGESASASGKQRLMETVNSVNAGVSTGESASASEVNIPYSSRNGKYTVRRKREVNPDESGM